VYDEFVAKVSEKVRRPLRRSAAPARGPGSRWRSERIPPFPAPNLQTIEDHVADARAKGPRRGASARAAHSLERRAAGPASFLRAHRPSWTCGPQR